MAIAGKIGAVYVSDIDTAPVSFTDQATTKDGTNTRYQVTNAAYRYWPLDATITVKKNGSTVTSGYTLERAGGYVVFDSPLQPTDTVTVSGQALTLVQCGGFFNWSIDFEQETTEATTFASNGWKEFAATVKGWSGSAEAYWGDDRFFKSLGNIIVVKLFVDSGASQKCFEGFAIINSEGIESAVDELVTDKIDFEGVGPIYTRI
jgi:predicted secreted protein